MTISDRSTDRVLVWLGIAAWAVTLGLTVAALWLRVVSSAPPITNRFGITDVSFLGFAAIDVAFSSVALVIVTRLPRHLVAWLLFGIGIAYSVSILGVALTFEAAAGTPAVGLQERAWLASSGVHVAGVLTFVFIFVYPDRRPTSRATALLVVAGLALPIAGVLTIALHPGPLFMWPQIDNLFGIGPRLVADMAGDQLIIPAFIAIPWSAAAVWVGWRFYRSRGVERLQLKWFVSAAVASVVILTVALVVGATGSGAGTNPWPGLAYALSNTLVPIAVGIAILRYRLYAIDHLIDRAIAYGIVTAILLGLFALLVVALTAWLEPITQGETVPVAAATIVVAALFQPVRRRVQRTIDRRFHRARYDAASTVDAFAERLRRTVDLEALEGELLAVVEGTVSPSASAVWVARGRGRAP